MVVKIRDRDNRQSVQSLAHDVLRIAQVQNRPPGRCEGEETSDLTNARRSGATADAHLYPAAWTEGNERLRLDVLLRHLLQRYALAERCQNLSERPSSGQLLLAQ